MCALQLIHGKSSTAPRDSRKLVWSEEIQRTLQRLGSKACYAHTCNDQHPVKWREPSVKPPFRGVTKHLAGQKPGKSNAQAVLETKS